MKLHGPAHSAYAPHETLVAPARQYSELWRLLAGLVLVGIVIITMNLALFATVANTGSVELISSLQGGSSPAAMLILLASFGFATLGVALAVRLFQRRGLGTVLGPRGQVIDQFWRVLSALLILGLVLALLPPYDMGVPLEPNLPVLQWIALLPFSLSAVLIQTSSEEILFRGYLQQSLAARFRAPWVWMGIPSILFAAGHYAPNAAGDNAMLVAVWACVFGLLSADLTARAGTLGPAIAMHFANNAMALLVISLPDSLSGLALFHLPFDMSDTGILRQWLIVDFGVMIVSWLVARLALRR